MKKLAVILAVLVILLVGCSSGKYTDKIDKAVKIQEKKQLSDDAEVCYYTYEFENSKAHYKKDFNSKRYYQAHEPDYKEENMN